ncbi:pentapeptide repeat-containing protein [Streptomyces sp. NPDC127168]|uniref:pentapeptide repeat-containing protein n=1 Tax=unclassified Streptomyces TaxID=2593676 RepID=UPI00363EB11F
MAFVAAVLSAAAVFYAGWSLLAARELRAERVVDSGTLFDLVKLAFGVVAGAGALVALVVAYRRQRVDEARALLDEDSALRDATRLHTERFTSAVAQLGDESAAVRLGGVHAMAGLADDAPTRELRNTCIEVLCAYLRLPYLSEASARGNDAAEHSYLALREVRHTVIRLIRDHLRLPAGHHRSWQGHDLDFTGVTFDGGDLSKVVFSSGNVSFRRSVFSGSIVDFQGADFSGADVDFSRATFAGGEVSFLGARFSGGSVDFSEAAFAGGEVDFWRASFTGCEIMFYESVFSGGVVGFQRAAVSDAAVNFGRAVFSGAVVSFNQTVFDGGVVYFENATFSGGEVSFETADFSGTQCSFIDTAFIDGVVSFRGALFRGGAVDFTGAEGVPPQGLDPAIAVPTAVRAILTLPAAWQGS